MISARKSKENFIKRLSKLTLLKAVNFPESAKAKKEAKKKVSEVLLHIGHYQEAAQMQEFSPKGEMSNLLKASCKRFYEMDALAGATKTKEEQVEIAFSDQWFVFSPDAYALTYAEKSLNGRKCFSVFLSTPILGGLYGGEMDFVAWEDLAAFIDSILIHELAHCYGAMNHGKAFRRELKALCEATETTLTI